MNKKTTLRPWLQRSSRTAFDNNWLRIDIDEVELPDGRTYDYTLIRSGRHGSAILAFNEQGQVLMEREFRYPVGQVIWQLPGGLLDPGESPLESAQRELAEETGHVADDWRHLGTIWDNPAFEDMLVHIFVAEGTRFNGETNQDDHEWVECEWVEMDWLKKQVRSGEIKERVLLAALGFLWAEA